MASRDPRALSSIIEAIRLEAKQRVAKELNSQAVLPDGSLKSRAEILTDLNLNPETPPEAWLNIIACGSNASALDLHAAQELHAKGVLTDVQLSEIQEVRGG